MAEKRIRITQTRSVIGHVRGQRRTLRALGIRKIGGTAEHNATPTLMGMVKSVSHLIEIESVGKSK